MKSKSPWSQLPESDPIEMPDQSHCLEPGHNAILYHAGTKTFYEAVVVRPLRKEEVH